MTIFNDEKRNGKAYIGDHNVFSKDGGAENWQGDMVDAATKDGDIRFYFEGEPIEPLAKKGSRC